MHEKGEIFDLERVLERFFHPLLEGFLEHSLQSKLKRLKQECILKPGSSYFDWTASGLGMKCIEERLQEILPLYANTHSESSLHSELMSKLYEKARKNLKNIFGLDESFALIACGNGSSAAIKKFQELLGIYLPPKTKQHLTPYLSSLKLQDLPLVLIGPYEHHSNELSFREGLCQCIRIPLNQEGLVDLHALQNLLQSNKHRKIIASFSLASNVTGILIPFDAISHLVRQYGGIVCYDMASTSPYFSIPAAYYDVAFLSAHKLLGGIGSSGLLIIKRALVDKTLPPTFSGGGVVGYVSRSSQQYFCDEERREEAGTPGILQLLKASLAYQIRQEISPEWIASHKASLHASLLSFLTSHKKITLYGNQDHNHLSIFAINIQDKSPYELCQILSSQYGILLRAGCSCAGPYGHDLLQLQDNAFFVQKPGWLRISLHYTHSQQDIEYLCSSLDKLS